MAGLAASYTTRMRRGANPNRSRIEEADASDTVSTMPADAKESADEYANRNRLRRPPRCSRYLERVPGEASKLPGLEAPEVDSDAKHGRRRLAACVGAFGH